MGITSGSYFSSLYGTQDIILGTLPTDSPVALEAFLSDPGVPGVRSMGPDVTPYLPTRLFADLTDVTSKDPLNKSDCCSLK